MHWLVGASLCWPVGVVIGRRMKSYQGGVPVVPYQRFVHDFPNLEPITQSSKTFRLWSLGVCVTLGYWIAKYTVNPQQM